MRSERSKEFNWIRIFLVALLSALIFLPFVLGLIHPFGVFWYVGLFPLFFLVVLICFLFCLFSYLCIALKTKDARYKKRLINMGISFLLFIALLYYQYPASYGLLLHYKTSGDFKDIRTWLNNLETTENSKSTNLSFDWRDGIPKTFNAYHPMYVHVSDKNGDLHVYLSWGSGLFCFSIDIIVGSLDYVYENDNGIVHKIEPGVYLHID